MCLKILHEVEKLWVILIPQNHIQIILQLIPNLYKSLQIFIYVWHPGAHWPRLQRCAPVDIEIDWAQNSSCSSAPIGSVFRRKKFIYISAWTSCMGNGFDHFPAQSTFRIGDNDLTWQSCLFPISNLGHFLLPRAIQIT